MHLIGRATYCEANHAWSNRGIACCVDPHVAVCIMNCPSNVYSTSLMLILLTCSGHFFDFFGLMVP